MASEPENGRDIIKAEELPRPLEILKYRDPQNASNVETKFYVLGTAHVSMQSCRDAADLIARVRPDFVLLELCNERISILSLDKFEEPNFGAAVAAIRSGKSTPFQALYSWLLAKVATNLEIKPGEEFRVALRSAQQVGAKVDIQPEARVRTHTPIKLCPGLTFWTASSPQSPHTSHQVVLGDRLVSVTLARVWGGLSIWEKLSLVKNLTWTGFSMLDAEALTKEIESMKEADVLTEAILEFGKEYPGMIGPLLTERNLYMVYMMRKLAAHASSVVAVVGAGHLQGIRENWESAIDIEALMELPPDRPLRRRLIKLGALAGSVLAVTLVVRFVLKRRA
ncbi:hypothetical protein ACKKBG_A28870 [Auxenochlorella protothecoides x Auxenochlorella symbiontica]